MINPYLWIKAKIVNALFNKAFRLAPIKRVGACYVKEVQGNLYVVDIAND